jgi:hypothetical protein
MTTTAETVWRDRLARMDDRIDEIQLPTNGNGFHRTRSGVS